MLENPHVHGNPKRNLRMLRKGEKISSLCLKCALYAPVYFAECELNMPLLLGIGVSINEYAHARGETQKTPAQGYSCCSKPCQISTAVNTPSCTRNAESNVHTSKNITCNAQQRDMMKFCLLAEFRPFSTKLQKVAVPPSYTCNLAENTRWNSKNIHIL